MALDLNDKTSNGNNLTNINGVTEATTSLPFAQSTSGADLELSSTQYLEANDSASLSFAGNFTIEAWVKFETLPSSGNGMAIVSKYLQPSSRSWMFYLDNNAGTYQLTAAISSINTDLTFKFVTWAPSAGVWYHLAFVYDTGGNGKFYVDGVQQGSTVTGYPTSVLDSTAKVLIGAFIDTTPTVQFMLDGVIDDVRIWNTDRSQANISANKSIELSGSEPNLVAYWPFELGLGGAGGMMMFL